MLDMPGSPNAATQEERMPKRKKKKSLPSPMANPEIYAKAQKVIAARLKANRTKKPRRSGPPGNVGTKTGRSRFKADNVLALRRHMFGVTQAELATVIGVSRSTYGLIERGEQWLRPEQAVDMAWALDCEPWEVVKWVIQIMSDAGTLRAPKTPKLVPLIAPGEIVTEETKAAIPQFKPVTKDTPIDQPLERLPIEASHIASSATQSGSNS
jgi:DNA-binding XRE family transcriptional regulator